MNKEIISLKNISYKSPKGIKILKNINFKLFDGDKIGLLAPNGSGKTTLFHIIMGLKKPDDGIIKIFGNFIKREKEFKDIRKDIGILFQNSDDQLFCPVVIEDVAFGPVNLGVKSSHSINMAFSTLKFLGIDHLANRVVHELSEGEKKMVALATILSMNPSVLLLDEPTTGLDNYSKKKLTKILKNIKKTLFIVSHEYDLLSGITNKIMTIRKKSIFLDYSLHAHIHKHKHKMGYFPHDHIF